MTVKLESFEVWENDRVSETGAVFLLQSRRVTENVTVEPVAAEMGEAGYTSEYQEFGVPEPVLQLEFPELLPEKTMFGL